MLSVSRANWPQTSGRVIQFGWLIKGSRLAPFSSGWNPSARLNATRAACFSRWGSADLFAGLKPRPHRLSAIQDHAPDSYARGTFPERVPTLEGANRYFELRSKLLRGLVAT